MKSPLIFRVFKSDQIHVVKQFLDKDQVLFGHEADVDIDLDSTEISPIHCLIEKRGNQYFICDLGSSQGTYKNGNLILDEVIHSGDEFSVGPFRVVFFIGAPKPVHSPQTSAEVIIAPSPVPSAPTKPPPQPQPQPQAQPTSTAAPTAVQTSPAPQVTLTPVSSTELMSSVQPEVVVKPAAVTPAQTKPQIQSAIVGAKAVSARGLTSLKSKNKKGQKTFAPESHVKDLRDYIKPGKGQLVEVIVTWQERIINTYHFAPVGIKKIGRHLDIQLPDGSTAAKWTLLDFTNGVSIRLNTDMSAEVQNSSEIKKISESVYRLQQNETVFITLANSMSLIVRFAPAPPPMVFASPTILSSSELSAILGACIIGALISLIVSVMTPKNIPKEEEIERVAQVIFTKPPIVIDKVAPPVVPEQKPPVVVQPEKPKVKPPEQIKKITESEKQKNTQAKGDPKKPDQAAEKAQSAGRANEVKPKDSKLKPKMFTSTKQGGAIKTGQQSGANAKSKEPDLTNQGLLSAFGTGGARSKLDKAYSGSGEALGVGEKATGASGFNESRNGDDVGSKFKDTGAGGKGTATQGIAGIGTKGRGTGMTEYGNGIGFGSKDQVAVQPGGAEEEFVGSIDREAVRRVVKSAISAFKACYDREYRRDSKLEGKVVISWEIHEKGIGKNAKVLKDKSTIANSTVEECVRARMLTLRFPEPPAGTIAEVTYPFLFQGQK